MTIELKRSTNIFINWYNLNRTPLQLPLERTRISEPLTNSSTLLGSSTTSLSPKLTRRSSSASRLRSSVFRIKLNSTLLRVRSQSPVTNATLLVGATRRRTDWRQRIWERSRSQFLTAASSATTMSPTRSAAVTKKEEKIVVKVIFWFFGPMSFDGNICLNKWKLAKISS